MIQTHNRIRPIAWLCLSLAAILFTTFVAWGEHNDVLCTACHQQKADASIPHSADDLVQPKTQLCLGCHDATLDVSGLNPPHVFHGREDLAGGSFTATLFSDNVGHNIQTVDMALGLTPPGGGALAEFGCLSCHDAHDNGSYRNLKKEINGYNTPVEANGDPDFVQNVYISGMNDFCCACHEKFNRTSNGGGPRGWTRHPVGITISGAAHADFENWSRLRSRVTLAELPSGDSGNLYNAQVFCLSFHRAHASRDSTRERPEILRVDLNRGDCDFLTYKEREIACRAGLGSHEEMLAHPDVDPHPKVGTVALRIEEIVYLGEAKIYRVSLAPDFIIEAKVQSGPDAGKYDVGDNITVGWQTRHGLALQ